MRLKQEEQKRTREARKQKQELEKQEEQKQELEKRRAKTRTREARRAKTRTREEEEQKQELEKQEEQKQELIDNANKRDVSGSGQSIVEAELENLMIILLSAMVLAAQGKKINQISVDEIDWLTKLRRIGRNSKRICY